MLNTRPSDKVLFSGWSILSSFALLIANNKTTGVIKKIITHPEPAGETGVTVKASEEEPRFLILNDHTQKETAYKLENIHRIVEESNQ